MTKQDILEQFCSDLADAFNGGLRSLESIGVTDEAFTLLLSQSLQLIVEAIGEHDPRFKSKDAAKRLFDTVRLEMVRISEGRTREPPMAVPFLTSDN